MSFLKKTITSLSIVTAILLTVSGSQVQATDDDCCKQLIQIGEFESQDIQNANLINGPSADTSSSSSSSNSSGCCGNGGDNCDNNCGQCNNNCNHCCSDFEKDCGETLTFRISLELFQDLGSSVIPFVSTPNGKVFEGTNYNLTLFNVTQTKTITIKNPVFGTYHVGLQGSDITSTIPFEFFSTVTASRDGSVTSLLPVIDDTFQAVPSQQFTQEFTYGKKNVP